ncbi:MAG: hypothetical protein JW727_01325 [Candidatus Aenigmarchaeota archaeon]|nr:hypothetical protein [Candidatus Aenigmarchaeota archaeon]
MEFRAYLILLLAVSFILIVPCIAEDSESWVKVDPLKSTSFKVTLANPSDSPVVYSLFVKGWFVWVFITDSQVVLEPGEMREVSIVAAPDLSVAPDIYALDIMATSRLDNLSRHILLEVTKLNVPEEPKSELLGAKFDQNGFKLDVYTTEGLALEAVLSLNNTPIEEFTELIGPGRDSFSNLPDFEGLGTGTYSMSYAVRKDETALFSGQESYYWQYGSKLQVYEETKDSLLASVTTVTLVNNGRGTETKIYELETESYLEPLISSSEPFTKVREGGVTKYIWELSVSGGQTRTFTHQYNYHLIFIGFFVAICLVVLLAMILRTEVEVKKSVMGKIVHIKSDTEIRICLEVTNRSWREIRDLTIEDFVQPIFRIKRRFSGVEPVGFYRKGDDIKIVWKIPSIQPREARVFTYTIVPKVGLGGTYQFNIAKVTYHAGGVRKAVYSNQAIAGK